MTKDEIDTFTNLANDSGLPERCRIIALTRLVEYLLDRLSPTTAAPSSLPPAPAAAEKTKTRGEIVAAKMVPGGDNGLTHPVNGDHCLYGSGCHEDTKQFARQFIAAAIDSADTAAEQRGKAETKAAAVALVERWRKTIGTSDSELLRDMKSL